MAGIVGNHFITEPVAKNFTGVSSPTDVGIFNTNHCGFVRVTCGSEFPPAKEGEVTQLFTQQEGHPGALNAEQDVYLTSTSTTKGFSKSATPFNTNDNSSGVIGMTHGALHSSTVTSPDTPDYGVVGYFAYASGYARKGDFCSTLAKNEIAINFRNTDGIGAYLQGSAGYNDHSYLNGTTPVAFPSDRQLVQYSPSQQCALDNYLNAFHVAQSPLITVSRTNIAQHTVQSKNQGEQGAVANNPPCCPKPCCKPCKKPCLPPCKKPCPPMIIEPCCCPPPPCHRPKPHYRPKPHHRPKPCYYPKPKCGCGDHHDNDSDSD